MEFPEDGYHGDDIRELARGFLAQAGEFPGQTSQDAWETLWRNMACPLTSPRMKADLKKYGIEYDQWFLESELHNSGYVEETVQLLTDKGWTYEKDGACG